MQLTSGQLLADNVREHRFWFWGGVFRTVTMRTARSVPVGGTTTKRGTASPLRWSYAQHRLEFQ